ncbi:MAG: FGGY-family carbohydrate kinase [Cyanobacteriota bacterium]|nr:FGGY-family carbohydrate kinase [Cyanobacteriota bacterium]
MNFYLGLDFGTSGARYAVIDASGTLRAEGKYTWQDGTPSPSEWQKALFALIGDIPQEMRGQMGAIALDGTSATVLLCDSDGNPRSEPLLYNDGRGVEVMEKVRAIAPDNHPVISATSSFAKLLWLQENYKLENNRLLAQIETGQSLWTETPPIFNKIDRPNALPLHLSKRSNFQDRTYYFLHQADWLGFLLHGKLGISDYHNALKLGYDVGELSYPEWLTKALDCSTDTITIKLPEVVVPGTSVGKVAPGIAKRFGLPPDCRVKAGTTDSIAAFLASGADSPGEAVTSLGSTLVLKLLSRDRLDDARYGIYSHRLGDLWLTGGASNTGGAVLKAYFNDEELEKLSGEIDPEKESLLDYYPLLKKGDRFPINDPDLPPKLDPKPENAAEFLNGLLEGIARIEGRGYNLLQQLGATPLKRVYTAGGGAKNPTWTAIRHRYLKVPVEESLNTEAAYGAAILAMKGINN